MVNKLHLDLRKIKFLRCPIPVEQLLLLLCGNWKPTLKVEPQATCLVWGFPQSVVLHQVVSSVQCNCQNVCKYHKDKICKLLWMDYFNVGNFHNVQEQ